MEFKGITAYIFNTVPEHDCAFYTSAIRVRWTALQGDMLQQRKEKSHPYHSDFLPNHQELITLNYVQIPDSRMATEIGEL